ncbi:MAG: exopolysaccharide biosynthesis polyprenyl glycosylphosphotransferase, partial [Thermomicrobiales bacterium]|nr:exopolysaccharide biosynthesis polyprenyl glycosylphosphotransferase [Thermomicrobiales bacterium]
FALAVLWWTADVLLAIGLTVCVLLLARLDQVAMTRPDTGIVVGQNSVAKLLTAMLAERPSAPWRSRTRATGPTFHRVGCVGDVADAIDTTGCRYVVVGDPRDANRVAAIAEAAGERVRVVDGIRLLERTLGRVPLEIASADGLLRTRRHDRGEAMYQVAKRGVDLMLAVSIGITILPLIPLLALAIRLDSKGPVFYRQQRVGRNARTFAIHKFRTMREDAERDGAVWATTDDPRVTRMGRVMRRTRLDELPQIWNVLRGDMSFVGPRPERPEFTTLLEQEIPVYRCRNQVRPGLTGWAQVRFRYTNSLHDSRVKLEYDLYYLRNASLWLDFQILVRTVGVVCGMKGC